MYLTGKLWSGLILSNKLYNCKGNVSWDHSAFLNVREFGPNYASKFIRAACNFLIALSPHPESHAWATCW